MNDHVKAFQTRLPHEDADGMWPFYEEQDKKRMSAQELEHAFGASVRFDGSYKLRSSAKGYGRS